MNHADEIRTGRERLAESWDEIDRASLAAAPPADTIPCVTTTIAAAYPTAARSFFAVTPVTVPGAVIEGGPVSTSALSGKFLAANVGNRVPPPGTLVLARRWLGVFLFAY